VPKIAKVSRAVAVTVVGVHQVNRRTSTWRRKYRRVLKHQAGSGIASSINEEAGHAMALSKVWMWLRSWFPQCGTEPPQRGTGSGRIAPHCGDENYSAPHGGNESATAAIASAEVALDAVLKAWVLEAEAPQCGNRFGTGTGGARGFALRFRHTLQRHPALVNMQINSDWVRKHYPLFCEATGDIWPPPYKDFAHELADFMPRKRKERWQQGRRVDTATWYLVPDPSETVVELAAVERRAAGA
jgi:hypothetical protein